MQHKQFVYIFEDLWNYASPHTVRLANSLEKAWQARDTDETEFIDELEHQLDADEEDHVRKTLIKLRDNAKSNGGFPDTDLMKRALGDNALHKFKDTAKKQFDVLSEKHIDRLIKQIKDGGLLALKDEELEQMDELRV